MLSGWAGGLKTRRDKRKAVAGHDGDNFDDNEINLASRGENCLKNLNKGKKGPNSLGSRMDEGGWIARCRRGMERHPG